MTILEAKKLAEQGKTVISPKGVEYIATDFEDTSKHKKTFSPALVFGEWREKVEPRRIYAIENSDGILRHTAMTTEQLQSGLRSGWRIVEFVEKL